MDMALDFAEPFTERTPRIVNAAKLHRARERRKTSRFLVEGENCVDAAVATGAATDLFITQEAAEKFEHVVTAAGYMGVYTHPIDERAARSLTDTVNTTGLFVVCSNVLWTTGKALGKSPKLVTIPVETSEPGNAGTMIRLSDAMGADAVLFAGETVDPQSGKAARASAGSLFHVPVARNTDVNDVLGQVKAKGLTILATTAEGEVDLDEAEEFLNQPIAWLFGNEAHGLPDEVAARADHTVRIPIRGRAESLNLATAAGICLYESARVQGRAVSG